MAAGIFVLTSAVVHAQQTAKKIGVTINTDVLARATKTIR